MTAENSSILRKPPCILDSQLLAGKVGTTARDSSPFSSPISTRDTTRSHLVVLFETKWIPTSKLGRRELACLSCRLPWRLCVRKQRNQSNFFTMARPSSTQSLHSPPPTHFRTIFFFNSCKWGLEITLNTDNIR